MKIKQLKKTILINTIISTILIIVFVGIMLYIFNLNNTSQERIKKIKMQTGATKSKTTQNNKKLIEIDKYKDKWSSLKPQHKSVKPLRSNEVKQIVDTISAKYHIVDMQFGIKVPQELKSGKFNRKSVKTYLATGSINFGATDDVKSLRFIQELITTLPGNIVIEKLSLSKTKEYQEKDFIKLSKEGNMSKIRGKVVFNWYSKRRIEEKNPNPSQN